MSLDGFIAGPNTSAEQPFGERGAEKLHEWLFNGENDSNVNTFFQLSSKNKQFFDSTFEAIGAMVVGRSLYNITKGWHGSQPVATSVFVLTHTVPSEVPEGRTTFTFVTSGIEGAIAQAKEAAGDKHVVVQGGANTIQQTLRAGLMDEIHIHLVPVLLGEGIRLFEQLGPDQIELDITRVVDTPGVTHLIYKSTDTV